MARIDDFKARFPNFDTAVVDSLFPIIEPQTPCYYGGGYDNNDCDKEIILQLWAHLLTIESRTSDVSVKNEASKSVGSVSVSYEAMPDVGSLSWFKTTRYGQQFIYLTSINHGAKFV